MESLSQLLEEELENAVEVKDRKSLHRYVILLTENLVSRGKSRESFDMLRGDVSKVHGEMAGLKNGVTELTIAMKAGFDLMDKRFEDLRAYSDRHFESIDKRFQDLQAHSDKRFEAADKRFGDMQIQLDRRFSAQFKFLTIGLTIIAVLMSLYNFL